MGLLLLAIATANPFAPQHKVVPLDFSGIDTFEFHGFMPHIEISSRRTALASYDDELNVTLDVRRSGTRLIVTEHPGGYAGTQIIMPASVRAIDVEGANMVADERLQSLQVSSSEPLTWDGSIGRLDLRDSSHRSARTGDHCACDGTAFTVAGGQIGELVVRSPHGSLSLNQPDRIDAVHAWLGDKGGVALQNARRFDNIHVLSSEAELPDAASPQSPAGP